MFLSNGIFFPCWIAVLAILTTVVSNSVCTRSVNAFSPTCYPTQKHHHHHHHHHHQQQQPTRRRRIRSEYRNGPRNSNGKQIILEAVDPSNAICFLGIPCDLVYMMNFPLGPSAPLLQLQAVLNQMVIYISLSSSSGSTFLKPATGHSQPLWGPPDPYLSSGHSIPPSAQALSAMGITTSSSSSATTTTAITDIQQTTDVPESVRLLMNAGYKVLDASTIKAMTLMPGFRPTGGILPIAGMSNPRLPAETPASFALQVEWSAKLMNVFDKLPEAAFVYALIEFFILRPGLDLYKDEIDIQQEDGPTGVLTAETLAVAGVRLIVFAIIAIVTNIVFG